MRPTIEKLCEVIWQIHHKRLTGANANQVVRMMADQHLAGYDAGRREGQAEAQRHLRLLLGVEEPTFDEVAYWNAPFPLKGSEVGDD
jgi:hypothetical protein